MKKLLTVLAVIVMSVSLVAVAAIGYDSIRSNREEKREKWVEVQKAAEEARIAKGYNEDLKRWLRNKTIVEDYITNRDGEEVRVITFHEEMLGDKLGALLVDSKTSRVFAIGTANDLLH